MQGLIIVTASCAWDGVLVQAAVTNDHSMEDSNHKFISYGSEDWKSETPVPVLLGSDENTLCGL